MDSINIWSVIVATIVAFIIGAVWYSPILFGKEWMTLNKFSDKDMNEAKSKGLTKLYVLQLIFTLISMTVLGFAITASGSFGTSNGAFVGFLAWLGFVLPIHVGSLIWEQRPFKLILISTVNMLLTLVVGGAIIGAW